MSWSIKLTGTREAVRSQVLANNSMPSGVRSAILEIINEPLQEGYGAGQPSGTKVFNTHARVEGHGHANGGCQGSIGKLEVELITPAFDLSANPPLPQA
ncbi:MAG TPA: hypothetical protein VHD61_15680 [Lacunisphaera sp.]|nr:hypothetical protein [Lacunisphaera sp.]